MLLLPSSMYVTTDIGSIGNASEEAPTKALATTVPLPAGWRMAATLREIGANETLAVGPGSIGLVPENVTGHSLVRVALSDEGLHVTGYGDACQTTVYPPGPEGDPLTLEPTENATVHFSGGPGEDCPSGPLEVRYREPMSGPEPEPVPEACPGEQTACSTEVLVYTLVPGADAPVDVGLPVPVSRGSPMAEWVDNGFARPSTGLQVNTTDRGEVLWVEIDGPTAVATSAREVRDGQGAYAESYTDATWSTATNQTSGPLPFYTDAPLDHLSVLYLGDSRYCGRIDGGSLQGTTGSGWIEVPGVFEGRVTCA